MNPFKLGRAVRHSWRQMHLRRNRASIQQLLRDELPYDRAWKMCELILSRIDSRALAVYSPAVGMTCTLRTPYQTVETYQKTLDIIRLALTNEDRLEPGWRTFEVSTISVSSFLRTETNFYLPVSKLVDFLNTGRAVCELVSYTENQDVGVNAHNVRILTHFFVRFRDTLVDLYDLQLAL